MGTTSFAKRSFYQESSTTPHPSFAPSVLESLADMVAIKHDPEPDSLFPTELWKPLCPLCGKRGKNIVKLVTRRSNRNGNANRPYLKCLDCRKFVTFTDSRGDHTVNKMCGCRKPSRIQVSSLQKGRRLHYESKEIVLSEDLVQDMAHLKLI